ncbi:MAG: O-antigen ligase family protein [Patescibacteria group bacterium]
MIRLIFFLFFVPFGMKKFLFGFPAPFANFYTMEYTSAFLYASDILILALFLFLLFSKPFSWYREQFDRLKLPLVFLGIFIAFSALSIFSAAYPAFSAYSFIRLIISILAAVSVLFVMVRGIANLRDITAVIALSAVFQSVVGFLQFILGKSVGLWFLGETAFGPGTPGIAKVTINGLQFARAYGTMPHANILAGFLVLGLLAFFYLFLSEKKPVLRIFQSAGIFIVLTGLLATFSRSGWITAGISALAFIAWEFFADRENRRRLYRLVLVSLVSLGALCLMLGWAISPRAHFSAREGPVSDRWSYNKIGLELIVSNPLGVGIGNQLFHTYSTNLFGKYDVNSWGQWQPIHNLYLIMASEIGILGLISFLAFIGFLVFKNLNLFRVSNLEIRISTIMLAALLLFGLFDHFLWDLQLGRLMLWVVIGILLGVDNIGIDLQKPLVFEGKNPVLEDGSEATARNQKVS